MTGLINGFSELGVYIDHQFIAFEDIRTVVRKMNQLKILSQRLILYSLNNLILFMKYDWLINDMLKVNVFFEYYRIGHATHSQQIARLNDEYRSQIPELATMIHQATGLTVNTN